MEGRRRVLGHLNGDPDATILFVGEAPGRRGAELHGVPFRGDASGHNFEHLLAACGLEREAVFITNAVICNPRSPEGNNAPPTAAELANCGHWLRETVELVNPELVVALGAVALRALARIETHDLRVGRDAGRTVPWWDRRLAALYHPGGRARSRRSLDQQIKDWRRVLSPSSGLSPGPAAGS